MPATPTTTAGPPEYNLTGHDYSRRAHLTYAGPPIIDVHAHVTTTSPDDKAFGPDGNSDQAAVMLDIATTFGIARTYTMCPPQDVAPLRKRFGPRIAFNALISKSPDEPEEAVYQRLEQFLNGGVEMVKLWAAPRGRDRGLTVDAPWRVEGVRRARAAGVRVVMVHVGDPDRWFETAYADSARFGTKPEQYVGLGKMIELFPDLTWIAAHMGGDPEHPDHLELLLERYPQLNFDTSATKWQVREVSRRGDAARSLMCRHPDRFLFGSDLVTRHDLDPEHYVSRYWCQRTLWESTWRGPSPIHDPDFERGSTDGPPTPELHGIGLPPEVLERLYHTNGVRLLRITLDTG